MYRTGMLAKVGGKGSLFDLKNVYVLNFSKKKFNWKK